jgi:cell division protein FtsW (lipid II flippase)
VLLAYALTGYGQKDHLPAKFGFYALLLTLIFIGGFALIRRLAPKADPALFPMAGALAGLGFAMIYRLDGSLATEQMAWLFVGFLAFAGTLLFVRDARQLDAFTYTIGLVGLVLLLLPVVPGLGREINGARLWVALGPFQFQPSELGKVFIVVFLASYLARKKELLAAATSKFGPFRVPALKHFGPLLGAWGLSLIVLFLEKDLGASLLFFTVFVVMLWIATGRSIYLLLGLLLFAGGAWVAWQTFDHVQVRVDVWLHALEPAHVTGMGYGQIAQGQFAMAAGGIFGTGLGMGQPWLIPAAATDFIFAAFGEELGLLGTTAVLLLSLGLAARGFAIAIRQRNDFTKLLAAGLSTLLGLQMFIIAGGVTRLIPLTGITLPFVSYGGSSLFANFIILALLIRISAGPAAVRKASPT